MSERIPQATETSSRWAGWIWAIPIAALCIVGYLAVKQFASRGPAVVVTFPSAGGVKPSDTKVQYQGLQVGQVESVKLQKDLRHVDVRLRLDSDMAGHLGPGTRFWIAGHKPNLSDLSSIKAVITGPYIGIDPHDGHKQTHYDGLTETPVVKEATGGSHFTLHAETLGTVSRGSSIYYRDLEVGTVEATKLQPGGHHFDITTFVRSPFDKLVHDNSEFWNAGAVQVDMAGAGPRLQFQSVPALFGGAVAFATPDGGAPAKDGTAFTLFDSRSAAENAPTSQFVRYRVTFSAADAEDLDKNAPVRLANQRVGSVLSSALRYDPASGQLAMQVILAVDPSHIRIIGGASWQADARPQMDALMRHLIEQGLRARVGRTAPVVGGDAVLLEFVPGATPASLGAGDVPELPSAPASDIGGLIASLSGVGAKLNAIPLDQIADDVHKTTQQLAALSQSPQLKESLQHLDQTLSNVDVVSHTAREQVRPILNQVHGAAVEAQAALASAKSLMASNGAVQNQPETTGLGNALYELSRAARSLRELANYLDQHPESLLRGKSGNG